MTTQSTGKIGSIISDLQFNWRINFDADFNTKSNGQRVDSPKFYTYSSGKEIEWAISVYPKGYTEACKDFVSIGLCNLSCYEMEIACGFYFLDKDFKKVEERFFEKKPFEPGKNCGILKFVEASIFSDERKNIIVDGEVTIVCQITINSLGSLAQNSFELLDAFEELYLNENFHDFTIITADEKKLHIHKAIVASRSSAFEAMFHYDMIEKNHNSAKIEDIKYEVLLEMFRYIYSNKVQGIEKILCELLYAANKYFIEGLKQICEETMLSKLDKTNAIKYLVLADQNNCSNVKNIQDFIVVHSEDFRKTAEFKLLNKSHPDLTLNIMNDIIDRRQGRGP